MSSAGGFGGNLPPSLYSLRQKALLRETPPKNRIQLGFSALARSEKGISHFMDEVRGEAVMEANSGKARLESRHKRRVS